MSQSDGSGPRRLTGNYIVARVNRIEIYRLELQRRYIDDNVARPQVLRVFTDARDIRSQGRKPLGGGDIHCRSGSFVDLAADAQAMICLELSHRRHDRI